MLCVDHKNTHKCNIEDNPLHQHPHEGDKEEVVDEYSNDLTMDRWTIRVCFVYASKKDELGNGQIDAQVHVDITPHVTL